MGDKRAGGESLISRKFDELGVLVAEPGGLERWFGYT
jgi:hypothetical protein